MSGLRSPLPALDAAAAAVAYDEVRVSAGAVWWLESRPDEGGRVALMRLDAGGPAEEVTPAGADVGCDLHGYGGSAYAVAGERIFYVDRRDGHIHVKDKHDVHVVLRRRSADEFLGDLAASADRVWCIRETVSGDELIELLPDGRFQVMLATEGFLGSPRPAPGRLAWLRWDADRMPWDGCELFLGARDADGIGHVQRVAGGRDVSVTQPQWDHQGRLWFISDQSGWWNLYRHDGEEVTNVAPIATDNAPPEWEAGYCTFVLTPQGGAIMIGLGGPRHELLVTGQNGTRRIETGYTSFKPYLAVDSDQLYAIAASSTHASNVIRLNLGASTAPEVITTAADSYDGISLPEIVHCPTASGEAVTALVYPPWGASADWCAPLVVRAHPGPTSSINSRLDWHVQYLTSHGFAVADVDYRGSSGYGRTFRRELYGRWGTVDVEDCIAVAGHLLSAGRTIPGRVFITGASAGGYTALQAVSQPSPFSGAVARSAIIDPDRWRLTAPRWQRPHAGALTGPAGTVSAELIQQPVLLIHGSDDHVAPVSDVRQLGCGLEAKGLAHRLLIVDARHRMSAQQAAARALEAELAFYRELLDR
ncbi:prolyl oligopeptidase family serine peptidase [Actinoplanes sp. NPDC049316]|uniref:alpha/beta hydrolase family protein n=1 Tax=Actinoplanes sp. NPDC049316 TaxID=3154727 RepID=UPI0034151856